MTRRFRSLPLGNLGATKVLPGYNFCIGQPLHPGVSETVLIKIYAHHIVYE